MLSLLSLAARPGEYDIARPFQSSLVQPGQPAPDWEAVAAGLRSRADDVQARINRLRGQMPTHTDPMAELDSAATPRGGAGVASADGGYGRRRDLHVGRHFGSFELSKACEGTRYGRPLRWLAPPAQSR